MQFVFITDFSQISRSSALKEEKENQRQVNFFFFRDRKRIKYVTWNVNLILLIFVARALIKFDKIVWFGRGF